MMKLKVWGGNGFVPGYGQVRMIVATRTKKRAMQILDVKNYATFDNWYSETGNEVELKIALEFPNTIFFETKPFSKEYRRGVKAEKI